MRLAASKLHYLARAVSALALFAATTTLAAEINITSGTVSYDTATMTGRTISIDGATARLIIDASHTIANGIDAANGGTLVNYGTITRTGAGEHGFSGAYGHVENHGSIIATQRQGVVLFNGGTLLNSGPGALIKGAANYGVSIQAATGNITNAAGGRIEGPNVGAIIWQGGTVTNTGAGSTISGGVSVLGAGGTVTNADGAEIIGRVVLSGGGTVTNTGTGSTIASINASDAAVVLENAATLNNSAGASISGARQGVYLSEGGTINNAASSSIIGTTKGVESIGTLTLTNSGTITGASAAILGNDTANITNYGTITATSDRAIDIVGGDVTNSGSTALIEAMGVGLFLDGEGEVINTGGARIVAGADGVIMNYGGNVTNAAGATIDGGDAGVVIWDYGTVTNKGAGSAIRSTGNVGVDFAPYDFNGPFILENLDGALVDASYAGVRFGGSGSIFNSGPGSTISANSYGAFFEYEPGEITNENGARIVSRNGSGAVFYYGGDLINRSGGIIDGAVSGVYSLEGNLSVLNTGLGTAIKGGIYHRETATITNADHARIEGGVSMGSGSVSNENATITATGDAVRISGNGAVTNTGTINAGGKAIYLAHGGTVTSTNGTIISGNDGIHLDEDGTVTLSGGTISSSAKAVLINGAGTISATNTTITAGDDGLQLVGGGTMSLSGGRLTADGYAIHMGSGGTIVIDRTAITGGSIAVAGDGLMTISNSGAITADDYAIYSPIDLVLTNRAGSRISGGSIGVYLGSGGGTIINEAGATIAGNSAIHAFGDTTLVNKGRLEGNVLLARNDHNTVTLHSGSVITGDLEIGDHSSSTLTLTGAGHQLYSNAVLGDTSFASKLIKTGSGTWIVDKAIDATIINIDAGTLIVGVQGNGQVVGTVNVNPGSVISGSGTVYGNLLVDRATVAPGNSPGVLTIVGGYAPGAGSVLEIELDPRNISSDRVDVIGNAVIDPAAELKVVRTDNNPYSVGTRYTVLTTTTGRTGTFILTGDLNPSGFLAIDSDYDANNAYLVVRQSRNLSSAALTQNQRATATALDGAPAGHNVRNVALNSASDADARALLDDISGEIHIAHAHSTLSAMSGTGPLLLDQLRSEETLWAHQSLSSAFIKGDGNGHDATTGSASLLIGNDATISPGVRLGLMGGILSTTTGLGKSSAGAAGAVLGLYGSTEHGDLALRFGATASALAGGTSANLARPGLTRTEANYPGLGGHLFGELAYRLDAGPIRLEPYAGLSLAGLATANFAETGTAMHGDAALYHTATTNIGVRASTPVTLGETTINLEVSLGWRHTLSASDQTGALRFDTGPDYRVSASDLAKDTIDLGIGAKLELTPNTRLTLNYQASASNTSFSHSAQLGFKASF